MSSDSSQEAAAAIDQQFQGQFGLGTWDVIAVIAYFVVILSVGLIVSSKPKNNSIFYLFVGNYYTFPQNILSHRRFSGRTETPWPDFSLPVVTCTGSPWVSHCLPAISGVNTS